MHSGTLTLNALRSNGLGALTNLLAPMVIVLYDQSCAARGSEDYRLWSEP